jgi:hypothetical protein
MTPPPMANRVLGEAAVGVEAIPEPRGALGEGLPRPRKPGAVIKRPSQMNVLKDADTRS